MSVTLVQIRAFLAVLDADGFSAAADELGSTQAALSSAVASFEGAVGGRVFDRQPRLALTALGEALLPHARAAHAAAANIGLVADLHRGRAAGSVRLAASTTACAGVMPALKERWARELPGIAIQVLEGEDDEMPGWLDDGVVDAAILINPASIDPRAVVVARDVFEAVVRRDHPLVNEESIPVGELLEDPVLVSDTGCRASVLAMCRAADPGFTPARDVRELQTVMAMVEAGDGVSIIPGLGRALVPESLALVPLDPPVERSLVLTGPHGRPWTPLAAALVAEASGAY